MLYRQGEQSMEKTVFKGPPIENPSTDQYQIFNRPLPSLHHATKPTSITLALKGSSAQYGEFAGFMFARFHLVSLQITTLTRNAPVDFDA
jgi:hypothetical protein